MLPTRCSWALVGSAVFLLVPHPSHAQEQREAVELTILRTVNLPWQAPEIIVTAKAPIERMHVDVLIDSAAGPSQELGGTALGATHSLTWSAAPGKYRCEVRVVGTTNSGEFRQELAADVEVVPPLQVHLTPADVDLTSRTLRFHAEGAVAFAELTIYDVDGRVAHQASTSFPKARVGEALELHWPALCAHAAKISVRVFNAADTWADVEWTPIQVEVPHQPIYLDEALSSRGQRGKFSNAYQEVIDALRAHTGVPGLRLYVLGVSSSQAKQPKAAERVQEVAAYFRQRGGLRLPILTGTFVDTDDESGNAGRVQTILALDEPAPAQWVEVASVPRPRKPR